VLDNSVSQRQLLTFRYCRYTQRQPVRGLASQRLHERSVPEGILAGHPLEGSLALCRGTVSELSRELSVSRRGP
jgi:hypothetical protein